MIKMITSARLCRFAKQRTDPVIHLNGSVTKYVYSAAGKKLRAVHYTAKPNISRTWGVKPAELTVAQILLADSTDYLLGGSLTMKNGKIDKYLFGGGYAQASVASSTTDNFAFYFYNQDHLGNIREVVDASGNVQQVTNYYPFGAPYAESTAADFQPYKYNGKELDKMHGLNTYDYGARQHDPILARWDRIDPLCEKYYNVSPYAYCLNGPLAYVDPDGRDSYLIIWATSEGQYGHAAFAVDNYSFDKQTLSAIPNGTVTVYGLFPEESYSPSDALFDNSVNASYSVVESTTLSDIMTDGSICGEESMPDGIIQIKTDAGTDKKTKSAMDTQIKQHPNYKGRTYNCSTFAREGVKNATGKDIKGEENFLGMNYVTPNALFNETKQMKRTTILLSPGDKTKYEFKTTIKEYKNKKK